MLFKDVQVKAHEAFKMDVCLFGQKVYLTGSRSEKGELMVVATNKDPRNAMAIYLRRWR